MKGLVKLADLTIPPTAVSYASGVIGPTVLGAGADVEIPAGRNVGYVVGTDANIQVYGYDIALAQVRGQSQDLGAISCALPTFFGVGSRAIWLHNAAGANRSWIYTYQYIA